MSSPSNRDRGEFSEGIYELLGTIARIMAWIGAGATLIGIGFLLFTAMRAEPTGDIAITAQNNIGLFGKILMGGTVALALGTTYLFWGEELLGPIQLLIAAALFFSPLYLPSIGIDGSKAIAQGAMEALRNGGLILGIAGMLVLLVDLTTKAKSRVQQGSKADQMKYGKGIREERDRQNVFMGRCWQLPYCRKFVRDKCPIYLARRTCWKELVGCMCEEQVIRDAMENKPIPKDTILAAASIPHNNKLTLTQKRERCKTCVIYNEHQKHKYRLSLPIVLFSFIGIYAVARVPLLASTAGLIRGIDKAIKSSTFQKGVAVTETPGGEWFTEILTICIMLVLLTYAMKLLEYLIFKLKV